MPYKNNSTQFNSKKYRDLAFQSSDFSLVITRYQFQVPNIRSKLYSFLCEMANPPRAVNIWIVMY